MRSAGAHAFFSAGVLEARRTGGPRAPRGSRRLHHALSRGAGDGDTSADAQSRTGSPACARCSRRSASCLGCRRRAAPRRPAAICTASRPRASAAPSSGGEPIGRGRSGRAASALRTRDAYKINFARWITPVVEPRSRASTITVSLLRRVPAGQEPVPTGSDGRACACDDAGAARPSLPACQSQGRQRFRSFSPADGCARSPYLTFQSVRTNSPWYSGRTPRSGQVLGAVHAQGGAH
jgi:hypothetical protein